MVANTHIFTGIARKSASLFLKSCPWIMSRLYHRPPGQSPDCNADHLGRPVAHQHHLVLFYSVSPKEKWIFSNHRPLKNTAQIHDYSMYDKDTKHLRPDLFLSNLRAIICYVNMKKFILWHRRTKALGSSSCGFAKLSSPAFENLPNRNVVEKFRSS